MNKPLKKHFCTPFVLDSTIVKFDSKGYSKQLEKYISFMENKQQEQITQVQEDAEIFHTTICTQLKSLWASLNQDKTNCYDEPDTWQAKCDRTQFIREHPIYLSFCALNEKIERLHLTNI